MIEIRKSKDRGFRDHGWLKTSHSFSFADYYDPDYMGFSVLRVINDDVVAAKRGFGMHGHNDMEIVTYVLEGELQHADSLGNGSVIRPGDVQRMSAGTGIRHSEYNPSQDAAVHLLQIWLLPAKKGVTPSYASCAWLLRRMAHKVLSPLGRMSGYTRRCWTAGKVLPIRLPKAVRRMCKWPAAALT